MGGIVRRAVVPLLLAIFAVAAMVKGALFHPIPILIEQETTATIEIPVPPSGLPPDEEPPLDDPSAPPPDMPFGAPAFIKQKVTRIDLVPLTISEPEATRDATVGGLVRLASGEHAGELQRTYSGKGPALCPT